ncbi:cobalamin-dependent protein [Calderihabitans maritimus]|uniref:Cobalamin B12-binding domain-containing protein n=1 Tax=Calderihabitans maritimus TaxID=1246530 RepID=A0A1Z5HNH1_9FIRM|nr:B12-binding domain-containing protein [Calderihabitans maritimus]GAW91063.1 cobalamin B12-binding domain-containing protein [Calderihabitans maritimus]
MRIKDFSNIFVRYDLINESPYYNVGRRKMSADPELQKVIDCVILGDIENIENVVREALAIREPVEVMYKGLLEGMREVRRLWDEGVYYLPQTILASDAMLMGLTMCEEKLGHPIEKRGIAITHTAEGDIHDLGQKIVNVLLRSVGFEVIDLGKDVPVEEVVAAVKKYRPHILCGTAHLSTTMKALMQISQRLRKEGIELPFACGGGGGVTLSYITSFAMGIYGHDASLAPKIADDAVSGMSWKELREKYNGN